MFSYVFLLAFVFLLRSIVICLTVYPDSMEVGLINTLSMGYRGSMMFSGHTATIVLSSAVVWPYMVEKRMWIIAGLFSMVGVFSIWTVLWTRIHYTADVVVSIYISTLSFVAYFYYARCYDLLQQQQQTKKQHIAIDDVIFPSANASDGLQSL